MTQFELLAGEFGEASGIEVAVENGESFNLLTDGLVITVQYRFDADDVAIFSAVSDPDREVDGKMMKKALELAAFGKGTGSRNLGLFNGAIFLSETMPLQGLDAETLASRILAFADKARELFDAL